MSANLKLVITLCLVYPVAATSKVVLPAAVCCKAKRLSFLNEIPCVSYMVLAWEILHEALPKVKQQRKLGIFSTVPDSALMTVLIAIAQRNRLGCQSEHTGRSAVL